MQPCLNNSLKAHSVNTCILLDSCGKQNVSDILASLLRLNAFHNLGLVFERRSDIVSSKYDSISRIRRNHHTRRNHDHMTVYLICPRSAPLFLRRREQTKLTMITGSTLWNCVQHLECNVRVMRLRLESISMLFRFLVSGCKRAISYNIFETSIFCWDISISESHSLDFLCHCNVLNYDQLILLFGLLQSPPRIIVRSIQVITLLNGSFQQLRKKILKDATFSLVWKASLSDSVESPELNENLWSEPCTSSMVSGSQMLLELVFSRIDVLEGFRCHTPLLDRRKTRCRRFWTQHGMKESRI